MGYILTPGVNGVNGVKEEGRGMEGIWGKSPARFKRAATPGPTATWACASLFFFYWRHSADKIHTQD